MNSYVLVHEFWLAVLYWGWLYSSVFTVFIMFHINRQPPFRYKRPSTILDGWARQSDTHTLVPPAGHRTLQCGPTDIQCYVNMPVDTPFCVYSYAWPDDEIFLTLMGGKRKSISTRAKKNNSVHYCNFVCVIWESVVVTNALINLNLQCSQTARAYRLSLPYHIWCMVAQDNCQR